MVKNQRATGGARKNRGDMKPTLVIFPDGGQLFACLWQNHRVLGLWTAEALPLILEAYKPLVQVEIIEAIFVTVEAQEAFDKTKTAQEVLAKQLSKKIGELRESANRRNL